MKTAACFIFLMLTCLPGHGAGKLQIPAKSELAHLKNALQDSNAYKTELVISEFYKKGEKQFSEKLRFYYANILICFSQNHSYLGCFTELKKRVPLLFNTKTKLDITPADQKILSDIYVKLQESGKYHLLHLIAVGLKNAENVGCAIHTCGMDKILNTAIASYDDGTFIFFANKLNYDQLNEAKIIYYYYTMLKNRKDKRCLDLDNYLKKIDPQKYKILSCNDAVDLTINSNEQNHSIAFLLKANDLINNLKFEEYKKLVLTENKYFQSSRNKYLYLRHLQNVYWLNKDREGLAKILLEVQKNRELRFTKGDKKRLQLVDQYNELKINSFLGGKLDSKISMFKIDLDELKEIVDFKEKFLKMSDYDSDKFSHTVSAVPDMVDSMYLLK